MPKGHFTAGACVLFDRPITLDELEYNLAGFEIAGRREEPGEHWALGGPGLSLAFKPEQNGFVVADLVDHPWPDDMGDPQKEPMLFAAWSMGQFGPFAFPGGLGRAAAQSWAWKDGKSVPQRHRAFVRLLATYAIGASGEDKLFPEDYDALAELRFVTDVAVALLRMPAAVAYFNPSGEVLRPRDMVRDSLKTADAEGMPPLDLWANVRLYNADEKWNVMDTVGHSQFEDPTRDSIPDLEACIPPGNAYDLSSVDGFFRNVALYLLDKGTVIKDGDTVDGPGGAQWKAHARKRGLINPPRPTLRFVPQDGSTPPAALLAETDMPAG